MELLSEALNTGKGTPDIEPAMQSLRTALAKDMRPIGDALLAAYQAGDAAAMTAALRKISKQLPGLAGDAAALSDELAKQFTSAFTGDDA